MKYLALVLLALLFLAGCSTIEDCEKVAKEKYNMTNPDCGDGLDKNMLYSCSCWDMDDGQKTKYKVFDI